MFSQASVCPQGGLPPSLPPMGGLTIPPPGYTDTPWTPPPHPHRDMPGRGQSAVGTHPTLMHSCLS